MNHKKLLLTLTLCLCALLCMVVTASASEVPVHSHRICEGTECTDPAHNGNNHGSVTFATELRQDGNTLYIGADEWKYDSSWGGYMLGAGTYYLSTDLTLDHGIRIKNSGGEVTLCLNGNTVMCTSNGAVIQTPTGAYSANFTLCDCQPNGSVGKITHKTGATGSGVDLQRAAKTPAHTFIMYNGCITGNTSTSGGGGVYVADSTTFTMYGGSIVDNKANPGRYASNGGGVYVAGGDTENKYFTMYGGSITGNHTAGDGGGIYSTSNNISIYGGSVTGNSAERNGGAVYVAGTMIVGGDINISGNWKGDAQSSASNDNANNVYLSEYGNNGSSDGPATIAIEEPLTGTGSIGITTKTSVATTRNASVKIAAGKGTHAITDEDKGHFTPDTGYCEVQKKDDGALYLTHVHSGGEATCTAAAKCGGCSQPYGNTNPNNHALVHHEAKAPTCTAKGWEAYDTCSRCDYTTKVEIPMAAHTYGTPTYVWAADNASCTATRTCTACQHVENETVNTQKQVTQNRSCTLNELSTFTATFTNTAFVQQIRENVTTADMTGHSYGAVSYTWATDNTNCKAEHKCTACQHVENETVNTQKQVTQNRSCTLNELSTFTATFTNTAFVQQIRENVTTADMTGHTYSATEWESNVDNHWHECSVCHTQIDKAEHNWKDATYTAPKTCTVCGATQGEPLTRSYYYYAPSAAENKKDSPKTADPGVLLYAGLALASLTGLACTAKKRH